MTYPLINAQCLFPIIFSYMCSEMGSKRTCSRHWSGTTSLWLYGLIVLTFWRWVWHLPSSRCWWALLTTTIDSSFGRMLAICLSTLDEAHWDLFGSNPCSKSLTQSSPNTGHYCPHWTQPLKYRGLRDLVGEDAKMTPCVSVLSVSAVTELPTTLLNGPVFSLFSCSST